MTASLAETTSSYDRNDSAQWRSGFDKGSRHRPLEVKVDSRGVESAIRLFNKLVLRDGILKDIKRRSRYEKPGERRRRKDREAAQRLRRQTARAIRRERRGL